MIVLPHYLIYFRPSSVYTRQTQWGVTPSSKQKYKHTTKPSNNPRQPAKPKSKSTASFANKAKYQSKQTSPPREPKQHRYESSISKLLTKNADLKCQVANLSATNTSLLSQVSQQDNNSQALNKSVEGI